MIKQTGGKINLNQSKSLSTEQAMMITRLDVFNDWLIRAQLNDVNVRITSIEHYQYVDCQVVIGYVGSVLR